MPNTHYANESDERFKWQREAHHSTLPETCFTGPPQHPDRPLQILSPNGRHVTLDKAHRHLLKPTFEATTSVTGRRRTSSPSESSRNYTPLGQRLYRHLVSKITVCLTGPGGHRAFDQREHPPRGLPAVVRRGCPIRRIRLFCELGSSQALPYAQDTRLGMSGQQTVTTSKGLRSVGEFQK